MDSFAGDDEDVDVVRARLLDELPDAVQGAEQSARDAQLAIDDMFGGVPEPTRVAARRAIRPLTAHERLDGEKDTLGLYLTGHPVDDHLAEIRLFCPTEIGHLRAREGVQNAAGVVVSSRTRRGRRGAMGFVELDDKSGRIEVNVFGEVYEQNRAKLEKDAVLVVEGTVQRDEFTQGLKLRAERIMTLTEARTRRANGIVVRLAHDAAGDIVEGLKRTLARHANGRGSQVVIDYVAASACGRVELGDAWRVDASDALLAELRDDLGANAVSVDYGR